MEDNTIPNNEQPTNTTTWLTQNSYFQSLQTTPSTSITSNDWIELVKNAQSLRSILVKTCLETIQILLTRHDEIIDIPLQDLTSTLIRLGCSEKEFVANLAKTILLQSLSEYHASPELLEIILHISSVRPLCINIKALALVSIMSNSILQHLALKNHISKNENLPPTTTLMFTNSQQIITISQHLVRLAQCKSTAAHAPAISSIQQIIMLCGNKNQLHEYLGENNDLLFNTMMELINQ
jgi:hypothetical protein